MTGQWEILREYVTPAVRVAVRRRLLEGAKLVGEFALPDLTRDEAKLSLLLVRIANPSEIFSDQEKALMDGPLRTPRQGKDSSTSHKLESEKAEIKRTKPKRQKPGLSSAP